jgi:predicted AAA+ superfamily ATPase
VKTSKINIPPHIRKRSTYLDKIKPFIGQQIIKVLTGQRRVGKSYLLYQLIQLVLEQERKAIGFKL